MGAAALALAQPLLAGQATAQRSRLLGDPGGWRSRLERVGVELQLFANLYGSWKLHGGVGSDDGELGDSGSYDLFALVDGEELAEVRGLSLLLHAKGMYDRSVNDDVGAISDPIDDADFDEAIYVDELWAQQSLWDGGLRLRAGFLEQQTVFDRNAFANSEDRQFLATFLDNGLVPLPNGIGAVAIAQPARWLELAAGVVDADNRPRRSGFDTAFDDFESLTAHLEATVHLRLPAGGDGLPGALRLGVYRDGRELRDFGSGRRRRGHWGVYLSFDQLLHRRRSATAPTQGLGVFARLGRADPDVSPVGWLGSAGLRYEGLLPGRDADVLGLGAYQAIASGRYRDATTPAFDRETGIELYYEVALRPWLHLTPDVQLILDPGLAGTGRSALLVHLRARLAF